VNEPPLCAVCATRVKPRFRVPPPELGPDLDLRPGEPARSTLAEWIRVCPGCGAAAPDLTKLPEGAERVVASAAYTGCPGSGGTKPFRRWALLHPEDAADSLLQAAWAADDADLFDEATTLRLEAAALWADTTDPSQACRRLDALRRAGAFDEASRYTADVSAMQRDEVTEAVIAFQRARIAARDSGRYLMSAALRPPAHAPHVSHGKRTRGGLWSRLVGR
jgi:hypothetical protein